jgi:hypothetical protein
VYVRGSSSAEEDARNQGVTAELVDDSKMSEKEIFQDILNGKVTGALRGVSWQKR